MIFLPENISLNSRVKIKAHKNKNHLGSAIIFKRETQVTTKPNCIVNDVTCCQTLLHNSITDDKNQPFFFKLSNISEFEKKRETFILIASGSIIKKNGISIPSELV